VLKPSCSSNCRVITSAEWKVSRVFGNRILAFDTLAARHFAELAVKARSAGKGLPTTEGYIAAMSSAQGFRVATRDVAPFRAAGLGVINPWEHVPRP
jgi:predicted nucleic acid-binding protein